MTEAPQEAKAAEVEIRMSIHGPIQLPLIIMVFSSQPSPRS